MEDTISLTLHIKAEAKRLGFDVCGITQAAPVENQYRKAYEQWIASGQHAAMNYMSRNTELRMNPLLLVPGVKSIICVALNYYPRKLLDESSYQLATYAYGKDYHDVMKAKLRELFKSIQERAPEAEGRCFCDSAPVMEKYWAEKAGLGWRGKNTQLIIPHKGSSFFLGEIFLNINLEYDKPVWNHCGQCTACVDNCPTHAIYHDKESGMYLLHAEKCLSYQTIENHAELSPEAKAAMGICIYGCDRCQQVCPHNRFAQGNETPEFQPSDALLGMTPDDWQNLTIEKYQQLFKGSAVKRAKFKGLVRNIEALAKRKP